MLHHAELISSARPLTRIIHGTIGFTHGTGLGVYEGATRRIGGGRMGQAYRATDPGLNRDAR
jgi:hypothetical protein